MPIRHRALGALLAGRSSSPAARGFAPSGDITTRPSGLFESITDPVAQQIGQTAARTFIAEGITPAITQLRTQILPVLQADTALQQTIGRAAGGEAVKAARPYAYAALGLLAVGAGAAVYGAVVAPKGGARASKPAAGGGGAAKKTIAPSAVARDLPDGSKVEVWVHDDKAGRGAGVRRAGVFEVRSGRVSGLKTWAKKHLGGAKARISNYEVVSR